MYLRRCYREKDGKRHAYWALVESYRTARGPRQRVVAWLGAMDEQGCMGVKHCAASVGAEQAELFTAAEEPQWVEVDLKGERVERTRRFGGPWLGRTLLRQLELDRVLEASLGRGREQIPWPLMAMVLVLGRLCDPSSALQLAERFYEHSALPDLLGVPAEKVNEDRRYRALDALLPHKTKLEQHLRHKLGELFDLDYDLLLYDVTSTYFEGEAKGNPLAQRGYLLRSNVLDWTPEELWRAYIQLTEAEDAFHIQKSDLQLRPVWHQKPERVQAHILVCFLAYVLWKTLEAQCRQAGLGDEPRQIFRELSEIALVDVALPTRNGVTLRKRCIGQPNEHQLVLLQRLGLKLPAAPEFAPM
jgi:hypothetical protein